MSVCLGEYKEMRWQEKKKLWQSGRDRLFLFLFNGFVTVITIASFGLSKIINGTLSVPQHITLLLRFTGFSAIFSVVYPGINQQRQAQDGAHHGQ